MRRKDIFEIDEKPVPLTSWQDEDTDVRTGLQEPMCDQVSELGGVQFKLRELEKHQRKDKERLLLDILECLDGFKGIFDSIERIQDGLNPQMKRVMGSFRLVRMQLENVLAKQGVQKIEDSATVFDPEIHQVSETVERPDLPDGHILAVDFDGYTWNGYPLRKPKVRVVRNYATDFDSHDVERKAEQSES